MLSRFTGARMDACCAVGLQEVSVPRLSDCGGTETFLQTSVLPIAKWYAVFTLSNHEKRIAGRCEQRQIESFLPLYSVRRKWKNRCTVDLELPLFPNYFFAKFVARDRVRVLELPGVVSIVSSGGTLLPIENDCIAALREGALVHKIEPHANLEAGESVRITSGPLTGSEGILERRKNDLRVVLRLEMLARSVSVEVAATQIERSGFNKHKHGQDTTPV